MKKILQITFAILLANVKLTLGQTTQSSPFIVNGSTAPTLRIQTSQAPDAYFTEIVSPYDGAQPFILKVGVDKLLGIKRIVTGNINTISYINGRYGIGFSTETGEPTDATLKMYIASNGNVGIGTTNPTALLQISTRTKFNADGTVNWGQGFDGGLLSWDTGKAIVAGMSGKALSLGSDGGIDKVYITTNGNVGIGTTNPTAKLEVNGEVKFNEYRTFLTHQDAQIRFGNANANGTWSMGITGDATDDFLLGNNKNNTYPLIVKDGTGNVGIGTAAPQAKLHVGYNGTGYSSILSESVETPFALYTKTISNVPYEETFRLGLKYNSNENNGFVSFYRGGDTGGGSLGFSSNGAERMKIAANGYVGIGTANPLSPLHLFGGSTMTHGWNKTLTLQATYPTIIFNSNAQKWGGIGYDYTSNMNFWVGGSSDDLTSTATAAMSIAQNGNIGLGITPTSTSAKLEVVGTTVTSGLKISGLAGATVRPLSVNALGEVIPGDPFVANPSANAWTVTGSNISNSVLAGNVGIGTATPTQKLSVIGNSYTSGNFIAGAGADGYYGWGSTIPSNTLNNTDSDYNRAGEYGIYRLNHHTGISMSAHSVYGGIRFYNQGYSPTNSNPYTADGNTMVMAITNNRVGVGTTTPTEKLEIAGNTLLSGANVKQSYNWAGIAAFSTGILGTTSSNSRFSISTNSAGEALSVNYLNGNVGIGTTNPYSKLQLFGYGIANGINVGDRTDNPNTVGSNIYVTNTNNGILSIKVGKSTVGYGTIALNEDGGNVSIGTTNAPTGYKLAIAGDMIAERVVVKLQSNWPDYVFTPSHQRASLPEVEEYINQNHHLPNIPSAQEVSDKGIDVGAMNIKFMEKIEELTLYLIEQNKNLTEQTKKLEALKRKNVELENAIKNIKK